MVTGYDDIHTDVSESVTIMGVPFWAENIQGDEPVNRRERKFTPILGGTERVSSGKYIHREFSFTTTWYFPTGKPDVYKNLFKKMMSKPVEVKSKYMGGTFKALVKITPTFPEHSPNHMDLDVTVTEVPGVKSLIDGESFKLPKVEKIKVTSKKTKSSSKKSNSKSKKSKSKTKSVKKKNK